MYIKPSASIRNNFDEISMLCKKSGEPIYLTKNGKGDLVVMDIESYDRRERMLRLREKLVSVGEDRIVGKKEYSITEVDNMMREVLTENNLERK